MESQLFINLILEDNEFLLDIHTSASIGCDERVRDIIENCETNSVIDTRNKIGWTPLMYAACCASLKVILFLLEEGANTDLKNIDGHTALILASKCGSTDVVNLLIDNGAKVNDKDLRGWTALFHAVAYGHRHVVQLLIEKGAKIDIMDEDASHSPLLLAVAAGHEMIVRDLLQLGANLHMKTKFGETAWSLAVKNGHMKVKMLIDAYLYPRKKNHISYLQYPDLLSLLIDLKLEKYYHHFESHGIDLNTFWFLSEDDLSEIGIQLVGPRKKMCMAISHYHQEQSNNISKQRVDVGNALSENKLHRVTEAIKSVVLHEKNLGVAAEHKFGDGIESLNYVDSVQCTIAQAVSVLEKLRVNHNYSRNLLCSIIKDKSFSNNSKVESKVDLIFHSLDYMQKLIDILHQHMISIQLTDFKK